MAEAVEEEVYLGRRAFAETQRIFATPAIRSVGRDIAVGWYGASTSVEGPGFALVNRGAGLDDLVGEMLRFTRGDRPTVYLYCLGSAALPTPVAVTRRAFIALGVLAHESLSCIVEVGL